MERRSEEKNSKSTQIYTFRSPRITRALQPRLHLGRALAENARLFRRRADEGVAPALHLVEVYEGRASRAVGLTAGALAVAGVAAALARRVILL